MDTQYWLESYKREIVYGKNTQKGTNSEYKTYQNTLDKLWTGAEAAVATWLGAKTTDNRARSAAQQRLSGAFWSKQNTPTELGERVVSDFSNKHQPLQALLIATELQGAWEDIYKLLCGQHKPVYAKPLSEVCNSQAELDG